MLTKLWRPTKESKSLDEWILNTPSNLDEFTSKYDTVQDQLKALKGSDPLLAGTQESTVQ